MKINYKVILKRIKDVSTISVEEVEFVKVVKSRCPECRYDPIYGASSNINCPRCSGVGYVESEEVKMANASVDRVNGLETVFESGGKLQKGQVVLTIHADSVTEMGYTSEQMLSDKLPFDFVRLDGKKYRVESVMPEKLQDIIYEWVLELTILKQ